MPDLDIESLLAPLPGDGPCGANLEYDPAFQALQEAAAGKPERQYGGTIIPAEPPEWPAVREQALALAARTRDLLTSMRSALAPRARNCATCSASWTTSPTRCNRRIACTPMRDS